MRSTSHRTAIGRRSRALRRLTARVAVLPVALVGAVVALPTGTAQAALAQDRIVSDNPQNNTPNVVTDPGSVRYFAQVGSTVVAGGNFAQVQEYDSTTPVTRTNAFAFNGGTGRLTSFAPAVDGLVHAVVASPDGGSVFLGGEFKTVNGAKAVSIAKVDLATGALTSGFKIPPLNGRVFTMKLLGNKLYLGGSFTQVGANAITGIAVVNATTGAIDPAFNAQFAGTHRGAGATLVRRMDISPDATRLVAVGNFNSVLGQERTQVALLDISRATPQLADWHTDRYRVVCSTSFQSYVHDVDFSPDGSYFVIVTTGAFGSTTLCDTSARFETGATGVNIRHTWANYSGGDTLWSVTITGTAVYVGGHFRWQNNQFGGDRPTQGSVARPGLAALDPLTGIPFQWNPTRVTGVGVFHMLATSAGLWVGHDTNFIGKEMHHKLAFFPLSGGTVVPRLTAGALPGQLLQLGQTGNSNPPSPVLYRVNAGGPSVKMNDGGPDWSADTSQSPSPYVNGGSVTENWTSLSTVTSLVPPNTPRQLYTDDRMDPEGGEEMTWSFPVAADTPVEVRLYFANQDTNTRTRETREFDVTMDGRYMTWGYRTTPYDISRDAGHRIGTMKAHSLVSDGSVDISFRHIKNNPIVSAIEVVRTCGSTTAAGSTDNARVRSFDGSSVGSASAASSVAPTAWSQARGAFTLSGTLYTGWASGHFCAAPISGSTIGQQQPINLGPAGNPNTLAGELPNVTAMFFADNRVYYTRSNGTQLFYRHFNPESGILSAGTFSAGSNGGNIDFSRVTGMFLSGARLYYSYNDGTLRRVNWTGSFVDPFSVVTLSGPTVDGVDWNQRALTLIAQAGAVAPNQKPTASLAAACDEMVCTFSSAGSGDPDGSITSYAWTFGDGSTSSSQTPVHTYATEGTYTVTLTVTDDQGATATASRQVTAEVPNRVPTASFTVACTALDCAFDASGSTDSDGSIQSYSWTFGDGSTGTGRTPTHAYGSEGSSTVTLTVTDNGGASASASRTVNLITPADRIEFVGSSNSHPSTNTTSWTVQVPDNVAAGDGLILVASNSTTSVSAPSGVTGWTMLGQQVAGSHVTTVWRKVAGGGNAGANVTVTVPGGQKGSLTLLAYRGTATSDPVSAWGMARETVSRATHTTPTVTVPSDGSWVVSLWTDKASTTTTTLTPPAGQTTRVASFGNGSGHISELVTDGGGPVSKGTTAGGLTATSDAAGTAHTMWTLVLGR